MQRLFHTNGSKFRSTIIGEQCYAKFTCQRSYCNNMTRFSFNHSGFSSYPLAICRVRSRLSTLTSQMITLAPSFKNFITISWPIPLPPPILDSCYQYNNISFDEHKKTNQTKDPDIWNDGTYTLKFNMFLNIFNVQHSFIRFFPSLGYSNTREKETKSTVNHY
ncbi:hypothetical protein DERF_007407 [Dermatophagoides farinae]|uniref:Uncharacterized protein n=1 Tax=Dermatophagoides farinae TaxID=6954 RepID=A0A922I0A4_DERFA|nr:hypothetical protein DERF_007407 [Dermatophagoides farinae]